MKKLKTVLVLLVWLILANFVIDIMAVAPDWARFTIGIGLLFMTFIPLYGVLERL